MESKGKTTEGDYPFLLLIPLLYTEPYPLNSLEKDCCWASQSTAFSYILFMCLFQNDAHHGNNCIVLVFRNLHQTPPFVWLLCANSESEFTMSCGSEALNCNGQNPTSQETKIKRKMKRGANFPIRVLKAKLIYGS